MLPFLRGQMPFPPIERAMRRPNGLLAAGANLSPSRLLDAYRNGIFPWFGEGEPILWWSPDPRQVLFVDELHVSQRLRRRLRRGEFELRANTAFREVMLACAEPREGQDGTWITNEMIDAYCALHALGHAHCVEAWREDRLAGGIYGVQIGSMFFGESMFKRETDASKVALAHLIQILKRMGIAMMDCQQETKHTTSLGARTIPRSEFKVWLEKEVDAPAALSFEEAASLVTLSLTTTSTLTKSTMPPKFLKRCEVCGKFSSEFLVEDAQLGRLGVCRNCWKRKYAIETPPAEKRDRSQARPKRRRPPSRRR